MRYIQKTNEPPSFTVWKQRGNDDWQPTWENFQKPEKIDVLDSLLQEQGFICCYCGQRIDRKYSHIEHFKPRHPHVALSLDYSNLLSSCPGHGKDDPDKSPQEFCGHHKKDKELPISPLDKDCGTNFRYSGSGEVFSNSESLSCPVKETIEILALNHSTIRRAREEAIEGILQDIDTFSDDDLRKLMSSYNQPDATGKLEEFCNVIIHVLKQYIN